MTDFLPPADFDALSAMKQFYDKVHQDLRVTTDRGERVRLCKELFEEYGDVMPTYDSRALRAVIRQASYPSLEQITAVAEGTLPANCKVGDLPPADFNAMPLEQQLAVKLVQMRSVTHEDRYMRLAHLTAYGRVMSVEQKTAIEEAQDECYDIWPRLQPNKAKFYAMSLEEQWAETFASLEGRQPWAVRLAKVEDTGNAGLPGYPGLNQRVLEMNSRGGILQSCLALYGSVMAAEDRAGLQADYDELMEPLSRGLAEFRAFEESSRHEIEESMGCPMLLYDRSNVLEEYLSSYSAALPPAVRYAMRREWHDLDMIDIQQEYGPGSDDIDEAGQLGL